MLNLNTNNPWIQLGTQMAQIKSKGDGLLGMVATQMKRTTFNGTWAREDMLGKIDQMRFRLDEAEKIVNKLCDAIEPNEFATYAEMVADVGDGTEEDTWNANETEHADDCKCAACTPETWTWSDTRHANETKTKSGEPCCCAQLVRDGIGHVSTCLNR